MSPYDRGWGRPGGFRGYGRDFGPGNGPWQGYAGDFRPHPGYGGGGEEADLWRERPGNIPGGGWDDGSVYGPARYGLGPYHQRLRNRRRPDDELKQEVEEALFLDTWVDAEAITVQVADGVVTLSGELPDYDEVRYATDDAWDIDGVRGVRSELRVNGAKRRPLDGVPSRAPGGGTGNG